MSGDFAFYSDTKYDVHYHGVINCDGIVMVHKQVDGSEYKQTDILHVSPYTTLDNDEETVIECYELKTNGRVHVSVNKLKRIMSALEDLIDIHGVALGSINSTKDMKALYEICIHEEPIED